MKYNKDGVIHFETIQEVVNYKNKHLSSEAIKKRARERKHMISYHSPRTSARVILQAIRQLDKSKHREGMQLLETIVKTSYERQKLVKLADGINEPKAKYSLIQQAKTLDKEEVYKYFMNEWKYTLEKIKELEKKTLDAIGDKINLINTPLSIGEAILGGM